jgi:hypothetical protein
MSAYQVHPDVIDLIVSAAIESDWSGDQDTSFFRIGLNSATVVYTEEARALINNINETLSFFEGVGHLVGDTIGRELVAANVASLAARYPRDTSTDAVGGMVCYLPESYTYRRVPRDRFADYGHVFGALACFEHQSCQTGEPTLADRICETVREQISMCIYEAIESEVGTSWEWTRKQADEQRSLSAPR